MKAAKPRAKRARKPTTRRGGVVPYKPIAWSLNMAAREFGVHREQLERRRTALGIAGDAKGLFTTQEIGRMMFGDKEAEALGKLAAERGKIERDNARADGDTIPVSVVLRIGARFTVTARQQILTSSMTDAEKDELLAGLMELGEVDWKQEARDAE